MINENKILWTARTVRKNHLFLSSSNFDVPKGALNMTVTCIGGGGGGGAGGGMVMSGGVGGTGAKVIKTYSEEEIFSLPSIVSIVVGAGGYGGGSGDGESGGKSQFQFIETPPTANGGGRGHTAGFGYHGSPGTNGSGLNGDVYVGSSDAERTIDSIIYGKGGEGTQGGGGGIQGTQGCVYIEWEEYEV